MRTFIAVDVSPGKIAELQNEIMSQARLNPRDVKPVEAQNFHFTLFFLGEKSETEVDSIKFKMAKVKFDPFMLTYKNVGAFPKPSYARVVWIGVDHDGGQKLIALANEIVAKMAELGFKADKPFSPHMTIFRTRRQPIQVGDIVARYEGKTAGSDLIQKIYLKRSDLSASGPTYSNIYTVEAKK